MKWFKHDSDAHRDAKIRRLLMTHGLESVGLYWWIIESIAGGVSTNKLTFELEQDSEMLSMDVGLPRERVEKMMLTMVDLGLFEANAQGRITCLKLLRRIDSSMNSNPKFKAALNEAKQRLATDTCATHVLHSAERDTDTETDIHSQENSNYSDVINITDGGSF